MQSPNRSRIASEYNSQFVTETTLDKNGNIKKNTDGNSISNLEENSRMDSAKD